MTGNRHPLWLQAGLLVLVALFTATYAAGYESGVPIKLTIDPGTVRQRNERTSTVSATVSLQAPASAVFVCQIRSSDREKIDFGTIVFRRGEIENKSMGTVHWAAIPKDSSVKISAYNVSSPDNRVWFTVVLKIAETPDTGDGADSENR